MHRKWAWKGLSFLLTLVVAVFMVSSPVPGKEPIRVVVTLNFLKDFVENIGDKRVKVKSLLTGLESEHTYTPDPADIIAIKKADILVKVGLGLEVWIESLIKNADNKDLLIVTTSKDVPILQACLYTHLTLPTKRIV